MDLSRILKNKNQLSSEVLLDEVDYESLYKITDQIIKKHLDDFVISKMYFHNENENFDSYIAESKNNQERLIIKTSYDIGCSEIINETRILKKTKPLFCNSHIGSGVYRSKGISLLYLILTEEKALNLNELGRSKFLDEKDSFLFALLNFKEIKSTRTFEDHLNYILKPSIFYEHESLLAELNEMSKQAPNILTWGEEDIKKNINVYFFILIKTFEKFILGLYDKEFFDKKETCHGCLGSEKVIFKNGLFKFIDVGLSFSGNSMFDLCWICLESGFSKSRFNNVINTYALVCDIKEDKAHADFYKAMDIVLPLFFARLLYLSFIEEEVYKNKRLEEIYKYCFSALRAFGWVNYSLITKKYIKVLTERLLDPLINAQSTTDVSVADKEEVDKSSAKIKIDPVEIKLEKIEKEDSVDLLVTWEPSSEATGYAAYFISPDGSFSKELTDKTFSILEDAKTVGIYGCGVRCLTDPDKQDSNYTKQEIKIDFLDDYFYKIKDNDSYYR